MVNVHLVLLIQELTNLRGHHTSNAQSSVCDMCPSLEPTHSLLLLMTWCGPGGHKKSCSPLRSSQWLVCKGGFAFKKGIHLLLTRIESTHGSKKKDCYTIHLAKALMVSSFFWRLLIIPMDSNNFWL